MVHVAQVLIVVSAVLCVTILCICISTQVNKNKQERSTLKKQQPPRTRLETEADCEFVSSRGLLKSCDVHPPDPVSSTLYSYNWKTLKPGSVVYIHGSAISAFVKKAFPRITVPFVLVSGDCDFTIPFDCLPFKKMNTFLNDARLLHWFSQNAALKHPKISILPIGLDYHTITTGEMPSWGPKASPLEQEAQLKAIRNEALPLEQRKIMCYANFQFLMNTRYSADRKSAKKYVPNHLVYYEPVKTTRVNTWRAQARYAFVISPHGNGYDCHRTWEALVLGCIPIIKKSPISDLSLFDGLPVLLVNNWSDVTEGVLQQAVRNMSENKWNVEKLTLRYWTKAIRNFSG